MVLKPLVIKPILIKRISISDGTGFRTFLCYFILIPFMHPRGFDEYFPVYKSFFTMWLYLSMALICAVLVSDCAKGTRGYKKCIPFMLLYYVSSIVITLVIQHGLGAGLQKMFAAPALGMISCYYLKNNCKTFLHCVCNITIIVLGLTVIVFNPLLFNQYFRDEIHMMFIGHVQIGAQYGMLGVVTAFLLSQIGGWNRKLRLLIALSVITMIMSLTSASMMTLGILFLGLIYRSISKTPRLLLLDSKIYMLIYLAMNFGLLAILALNKWMLPFNFLTLHGRNFIWKEGVSKFMEQPWVGYGVHGTFIKVFWSRWIAKAANGMNYAHNQMLQVALDGGVVLMACFLLMMLFYVKAMENAPKNVRSFSNICLMAILVIMTVESTFEYHYIVMIVSLLAYSKEVCSQKSSTLKLQEVFNYHAAS